MKEPLMILPDRLFVSNDRPLSPLTFAPLKEFYEESDPLDHYLKIFLMEDDNDNEAKKNETKEQEEAVYVVGASGTEEDDDAHFSSTDQEDQRVHNVVVDSSNQKNEEDGLSAASSNSSTDTYTLDENLLDWLAANLSKELGDEYLGEIQQVGDSTMEGDAKADGSVGADSIQNCRNHHQLSGAGLKTTGLDYTNDQSLNESEQQPPQPQNNELQTKVWELINEYFGNQLNQQELWAKAQRCLHKFDNLEAEYGIKIPIKDFIELLRLIFKSPKSALIAPRPTISGSQDSGGSAHGGTPWAGPSGFASTTFASDRKQVTKKPTGKKRKPYKCKICLGLKTKCNCKYKGIIIETKNQGTQTEQNVSLNQEPPSYKVLVVRELSATAKDTNHGQNNNNNNDDDDDDNNNDDILPVADNERTPFEERILFPTQTTTEGNNNKSSSSFVSDVDAETDKESDVINAKDNDENDGSNN